MQQRPVLYLDLDDTVISWSGGTPAGAPGLQEFMRWALDALDVRWLTRWARDGQMEPRLVSDLARMSGVPADRLARIRGLGWDETDCKLNGVAWLEHVVLGRPFIWLEDETIGATAATFLAEHGFTDAHWCCNVTRDPDALRRAHRRMQHWLDARRDPTGTAPVTAATEADAEVVSTRSRARRVRRGRTDP